MGRFLTILGLLMIVGSALAFGAAVAGPMQNFNPLGEMEKQKENLCKPGEHYEEEQGPSTYTQGQGYGRPTVMYCVNAEGTKRNVTGDFVQGMAGGVSQQVLGLISGFTIPSALCGLGIMFMVIGVIASALGRGRQQAQVYTTGYTTIPNTGFQQPQQFNVNQGGTLNEKLRQLENARNQGLITQSEYDRMRQDILDSMK